MSRSNKTSYADSGVSIKRGDQLVDIIKPLAKTTFRKEIIGSIGGFAAASVLPKKYKKLNILETKFEKILKNLNEYFNVSVNNIQIVYLATRGYAQ